MHTFVETVSVTGAVAVAIVGTIMTLSLFYKALAWLSSTGAKPERLAVRGILQKDTLTTVHLSDRQTFERVRLVGFTNSESVKYRLPLELNEMVILSDEKETRFLVRASDIKMIVVAAAS